MTRAWVLCLIALSDPRGLPETRWYLDAATCRAALVDVISAAPLRDAWCQEVRVPALARITMEGVH